MFDKYQNNPIWWQGFAIKYQSPDKLCVPNIVLSKTVLHLGGPSEFSAPGDVKKVLRLIK